MNFNSAPFGRVMGFNLCQIFWQIVVVSVGFGGGGAAHSDESPFLKPFTAAEVSLLRRSR